MTTEEKQFNDPMDKWLSQALVNQIQNMQDILSVLENPIMRTPVAEMGLKPETVDEISKNISGDIYTYTLAAKDDFKIFSDSSRRDIYEVLEKNGFTDFKLPKLAARYNQEMLIRGLWHDYLRMDVNDPLNDVIAKATSRLEELNAAREAELKLLHIVTITLPGSVALLNDGQKVYETSRDVLAEKFTAAIQKLADDIVVSDVEDLQSAVKRPNFLTRFAIWVCRTSNTIEMLKPQINQSPDMHQSKLTLEFAARANVDDQLRLKMLQPLFAQVAEGLSGLALTESICERLLSVPILPDPEKAKEPYDWIDFFGPHTPT